MSDNYISLREPGSLLYEMDSQFNPFQVGGGEKGIFRHSVFFVHGEKFDKTFYYNHQYPKLRLANLISEHYLAYFDVIAYYGSEIEKKGALSLRFWKGYQHYEKTRRSRVPLQPVNAKRPKPIRAGMDKLLGDLNQTFLEAAREAYDRTPTTEPKFDNVPELMFRAFDEHVFTDTGLRGLLIVDDFTSWAERLFHSGETLTLIKRWCDPNIGLLARRHMLVFLMREDFSHLAQATAPLLAQLHRELAALGNAHFIALNGHNRTELASYLMVQSIAGLITLPFERQRIPEVAEVLASASNISDTSRQEENRHSFRSNSFDISRLQIELNHPDTWEEYYRTARRSIAVVNYQENFATQIYPRELFEQMLEWLEGALASLEDNTVPVPSRNLFLYGPPGTGKTTFVKALVGEFGFSLVDDDYVSQYVGGGATNISNTFRKSRQIFAQRRKPVIIFQDEFGRMSDPGPNSAVHASANQEMAEQYKNELDSTRDDTGVFMIAGANKSDITPALLERMTPMLIPLPGPTEIYRYLRHNLPVQNLVQIDMVDTADRLYDWRLSVRKLANISSKLRRFITKNQGHQITWQDIERVTKEYSTQDPEAGQLGFEAETRRAYPTIGQMRDPDQEEQEIQVMIEDSRRRVQTILERASR